MPKYVLAAVNNKSYASLSLLNDMNVPGSDIVMLPGTPEKCADKLSEIIQSLNPEVAMMFWQKPLNGVISIETMAGAPEIYKTNYDYADLANFLEEKGYSTKISTSPGNSFANIVYSSVLKFIMKNELSTRFLFVHIPVLISPSDLNALSHTFERFFRLD